MTSTLSCELSTLLGGNRIRRLGTTSMTNNNTKSKAMNEAISAVKMIIDTKFISSGFVIDLVIIKELENANIDICQDNINFVLAAIA